LVLTEFTYVPQSSNTPRQAREVGRSVPQTESGHSPVCEEMSPRAHDGKLCEKLFLEISQDITKLCKQYSEALYIGWPGRMK